MDFEKLKNEAFETAKAHGWHDEELSDETYLMLIITEIAEAVQADRKGKHADAGLFNADVETLDMADGYDLDVWKRDFEIYIKNTVEDELADTVIRILDFSEVKGFGFDSVNTRARRAYKWYRGNGWDIGYTFPMFCYALISNIYDWRKPLEGDLSLVLERLLVYCKLNSIDIDFFVEQKMKYNKLRSYRHGHKKY